MTTSTGPGLAPVRATLANGAVLLAKASNVTPAVTIHASFLAGSGYDPPGLDGVAHFVSRAIDRGTTSRDAEAIAEALDNRGVSLSTAVNRHVLSLVCTCLVEDLEPMLALIGDMAMHPSFPEDEIATRRGEIITLIRQDEDSPAAMASEGLLALLYGSTHPYGRRSRGTVDSVEAMDRRAIAAFHARHVQPHGLSLVMVGDIEPRHAIDMASRVFDPWGAGAGDGVAAPALFPEALPRRERIVRVLPMMNKAQADIAYGFTAIRRADPDYYACWLMNNILGQYSIGGRLGDSIREKQGMAYYVFSALDANIIPGPLMIRAGVNPSNVDRAVQSIDNEVVRMAADGPTTQELAESKQYLIGSMPRNLETNLGIATFLQTVEFFNLGLDYDRRLPDLLRAVTQDDVLAAARKLLDPARAAVVIAGPYAGEPQSGEQAAGDLHAGVR